MSNIGKGIICRICSNNKDGICTQGNTFPVDKKDECWTFQDRNKNSAVGEASEIKLSGD
ncbi:hypothetical protein [Lysinibacillus xylanilyticus]|uniref:hypothetical protein n=1 Tax=Lysinibacillus xylanilyticus TaxID=582475 RepID=UPI0036D78307